MKLPDSGGIELSQGTSLYCRPIPLGVDKLPPDDLLPVVRRQRGYSVGGRILRSVRTSDVKETTFTVGWSVFRLLSLHLAFMCRMINKGSSLRVSLIFELGRMCDLVGLSDIRGHGDGDGVTFFAVIPECFTDTQIM